MYATKFAATAMAGAIALGPRATMMSAQATVDIENRYANVGAIMVWRVDDAGNPVELRGFVSGTLIRDRVMVTAGHFTAPAKALGTLPPSIRIFASFSPTNAKDPKTWIPVVGLATHPSMPHCPPPPQCDPTDEILVAPLEPGIADVGLVFLAQSPRGVTPARLADDGALGKSEGRPTTIVGLRHYGAKEAECLARHGVMGRKATREDVEPATGRGRDLGAVVDPELRMLRRLRGRDFPGESRSEPALWRSARRERERRGRRLPPT
jgi:hypothetical protein